MKFRIVVCERTEYAVEAACERAAISDLLTDIYTGSVDCSGHSTELVGNVGTTYEARSVP